MVKEYGILNSFQNTTLDDFSFSLVTLNYESEIEKKLISFDNKFANNYSVLSLVGLEYKKQLNFQLWQWRSK